MARDYNEQAPDGSWRHVVQHDDGTYTTTPIPRSDYGAANIPGSSGNGLSAEHRAALQRAGYGDWNNPNLTEADYAQIAAGAEAGVGAGGYGTGTSVNITAAQLAEEQVRDAATAAYQKALIQGASDRLAFDKAQQAAQQTLETLKFAATLTGPANAFEYAKALNGTPGGMADIVNAASGGYRLPATGGGNGQPITPLSISSILDDIAKYSPPAASTPAAPSGAPGTYQTVNGVKTLAQMQAELRTAGWGGNYDDPNAVVAAYAGTTKGPVTPSAPGAAPDAAKQTATMGNQVVTSGYHPPAAPPTAGNQITVTHGPLTITHTVPPTPAVATQSAYTPAMGNQTATTRTPPSGTPMDPTLHGGPVTVGKPTPLVPSYVPQFGTLPHPNQIDPQNWQAMAPSQQQLLLGAYADQGWKTDDVLAAMTAGLKGYGGPAQGSIGF